MATLAAFAYCLEATAQDDALEVLEELLYGIYGGAIKADKKARLRTLKDLDQAAAILASACQMLLDEHLPDTKLRARMFEKIPRDTLVKALDGVTALIRPDDNVHFQELDAKYKTVRRFLPRCWNTFISVPILRVSPSSRRSIGCVPTERRKSPTRMPCTTSLANRGSDTSCVKTAASTCTPTPFARYRRYRPR